MSFESSIERTSKTCPFEQPSSLTRKGGEHFPQFIQSKHGGNRANNFPGLIDEEIAELAALFLPNESETISGHEFFFHDVVSPFNL
jgi:hypothetical protein